MAYPAEIVTRDVTVGGSFAIESGDALTVRAKVTASRGMIWTATGYRFPSVPATKTGADAGSEVTFTLPVTDQAGWRDMATPGSLIDVSTPGSYTHRYTVTLETLGDGATILARATIGPFVLPTEDLSPIDLDLLVSSGTVAGDVVLSGDFAPVDHTHTASDISDSTVVGRAVLTAADAAAARTAIGAAEDGVAAPVTSDDITDATVVGKAVLTAADAADARTTLGAAATTHTHVATQISDSTITGRALMQAASGTAARTAIGAAAETHTHVIDDVTGLQDALDAAGASGGVTDHGALTGLGGDDHTQYALADGTRGDFATTAQGALADSAVQPADLATVATSGAYADLSGTPAIPADLGDLGDVDTAGATIGQALVSDGAGGWSPGTVASGGSTAYSATVTIPTGWTTSTGITVTGLVDTTAAIIGPVNSGSEWGTDWVISTGADTLTVTGTAPSAAVSAKLMWWA